MFLIAQRMVRSRSGRRFGLSWLALAGALLAAESAHAQLARVHVQPVTTATVGKPYVYEVVATGPSSGSLKITAPGGLTGWLSLKTSGNGHATLSGTPTVPGTATVVLRAEDSICTRVPIPCTAQAIHHHRVASTGAAYADTPDARPTDARAADACPTPECAAARRAPGYPGSIDRRESDAEPERRGAVQRPRQGPLTFTVSGLPAGFGLAAGVISGVATLTTANGSPYNVTVTAADGRGGSVSDAFVLSVKALARSDLTLNGITATPAPAASGAPVSWVVTVGNARPEPERRRRSDARIRGHADHVHDEPVHAHGRLGPPAARLHGRPDRERRHANRDADGLGCAARRRVRERARGDERSCPVIRTPPTTRPGSA